MAQAQDAPALAELKQVRQDYPDSVMTEQVLQSIGVAAVALNQPADAVSALEAYSLTAQRPGLLLLRGEAYEKAGQLVEAAADYKALYTRFSLSEQAREATTRSSSCAAARLGKFRKSLSISGSFTRTPCLTPRNGPPPAVNTRPFCRELSGANMERAQLRILECGVALGSPPSQVIALKVTDPDVDAERSYALADYYRGHQLETDMAAAVENAVSRAPSSRWAASALFLAGNYYWVRLDRDRAASYYKRLADQFPNAPDAVNAQWRVTWTAVLKRAPEGAELLQQHLKLFPGSIYTPDALYWLGRSRRRCRGSRACPQLLRQADRALSAKLF